jgi:hypothetical protein
MDAAPCATKRKFDHTTQASHGRQNKRARDCLGGECDTPPASPSEPQGLQHVKFLPSFRDWVGAGLATTTLADKAAAALYRLSGAGDAPSWWRPSFTVPTILVQADNLLAEAIRAANDARERSDRTPHDESLNGAAQQLTYLAENFAEILNALAIARFIEVC